MTRPPTEIGSTTEGACEQQQEAHTLVCTRLQFLVCASFTVLMVMKTLTRHRLPPASAPASQRFPRVLLRRMVPE